MATNDVTSVSFSTNTPNVGVVGKMAQKKLECTQIEAKISKGEQLTLEEAIELYRGALSATNAEVDKDSIFLKTPVKSNIAYR